MTHRVDMMDWRTGLIHLTCSCTSMEADYHTIRETEFGSLACHGNTGRHVKSCELSLGGCGFKTLCHELQTHAKICSYTQILLEFHACLKFKIFGLVSL